MKRDTMKRPIALATGIVFTLLFEVNPAFAAPPTGPTDLAVTMTAAPATVAAGTDLTYIIHVTNNGPALATGVTVRDTLPAGVTFVSANVNVMGDTGAVTRCRHEAGATGTGGTVSCTIGSLYPKPVSRAGLPPILDPAHPFSATVVLVVRPIAAGTISNVASARADLRDNNPDNNLAKSNSTVTWGSDSLELVSLSPPGGTTLPGLEFNSHNGRYEAITSTNSVEATIRYKLASASEGVVGIGDFKPYFRVYRGFGEARARFSRYCTGFNQSSHNQITSIMYWMAGTDAEGRSTGMLLQKTGNVNYTFTCGQQPAQTPVKPSADLALVKTASVVSGLMGSAVTYQLTVTNNGPSPATNVVVTDALPLPSSLSRGSSISPVPAGPPTVAFVSAQPSQGSCNLSGATLTCPLGNLGLGNPGAPATATITIMLRVTESQTLRNSASVIATEYDPRSGNNTAAIATTVASRPLPGAQPPPSPAVPAQPSLPGPPPRPMIPTKPPLPGAPSKPSPSPSK